MRKLDAIDRTIIVLAVAVALFDIYALDRALTIVFGQ